MTTVHVTGTPHLTIVMKSSLTSNSISSLSNMRIRTNSSQTSPSFSSSFYLKITSSGNKRPLRCLSHHKMVKAIRNAFKTRHPILIRAMSIFPCILKLFYIIKSEIRRDHSIKIGLAEFCLPVIWKQYLQGHWDIMRLYETAYEKHRGKELLIHSKWVFS